MWYVVVRDGRGDERRREETSGVPSFHTFCGTPPMERKEKYERYAYDGKRRVGSLMRTTGQ